MSMSGFVQLSFARNAPRLTIDDQKEYRMSKKAFLFLLLVCALGSMSVWAQSNLGSIVGTVTDASEAAVPSVSVTVKKWIPDKSGSSPPAQPETTK
jgi:hypothetical protein